MIYPAGYLQLMKLRCTFLAPSGSPQSFTGYLSHLHNSAKFRWGTVDEGESNGLVIGYNFSCNYSSDGDNIHETVNMNFDNAIFQFELDIIGSMKYECAIAASTGAGRGPNSAPVYFTTPGNTEGTHFTSDFYYWYN